MLGHDLVGFYAYAPCLTYNTSQITTANQSIPNTVGNGTIPPVAVTGLSPEMLYCFQSCVIDLDANATLGYPTGPVCGAMETFSWPSPVRSLVLTRYVVDSWRVHGLIVICV